jgi:putative peptidoglycan lipid II flippase
MASIFQLFPNSRPDSINRKIFRAALIVGALSVVARIAGTSKELIVAQVFGRTDALDAFLIAYLLPSFLMNLSIGALGSALLPVLVEAREKQGDQEAERLLSSIVFFSVIGLSLLALILGVGASFYLPFLAHNFGPAKLLLTRHLLYALLPWMVFSGVATLLAYIMNARERFALPAIVPLLTPLITIGFVLGAASRGPYALAAGTVAGGILEAVVLFRIVIARATRVHIRWHGLDSNVRRVLRQYAPTVAGTFLMGGTALVDQSLAAMLPAGSVAALNYANKITNAILLVGGTALSTAALPYFSRMVVENNWWGCRHTLKRYALLITTISIPVTVLLAIFSKSIVRILFQRGAFTSADTQVVGLVQLCYCLQIPTQALCILFARFLTAVRRNDLIMYASALNLIVDIVGDIVLMRIWGIAGIALSTAIVTFVSLLFLSISSIKLLRQPVPESMTAVQAHASQ